MIYHEELMEAIKMGDLKEVKSLVKQGADIHFNDEQALVSSVFHNYLEITKYLLSKKANIHVEKRRILQYAGKNGNVEMIEFLQNNGLNIKENNGFLLVIAAENNHKDLVKFLIEQSIPISKPHLFSNARVNQSMKKHIQDCIYHKALHTRLVHILNEQEAKTISSHKI